MTNKRRREDAGVSRQDPTSQPPLEGVTYELTQRAYHWERAGREPSLLAYGEELARMNAVQRTQTEIEEQFIAESLRAGGSSRGLGLNRFFATSTDAFLVVIAMALSAVTLGPWLGGKLGAACGYILYFGGWEFAFKKSLGMSLAGLEFERAGTPQTLFGRVMRAMLAWIPFLADRLGHPLTAQGAAAAKRPLIARIIIAYHLLGGAFFALCASIWILMIGNNLDPEQCGSRLTCAGAGLIASQFENFGIDSATIRTLTAYDAGTAVGYYIFLLLAILLVCWLVRSARWTAFRLIQLVAIVSALNGQEYFQAISATAWLLLTFHRSVRNDHSRTREYMRVLHEYKHRRQADQTS